MATSVPIRETQQTPVTTANPILQALHLWHLLSLDAPTVAVVWTAAIADCTHCALGRTTLPAMFCAVWMIYAVDRLLDARRRWSALEPRHHFHHRHRKAFLTAIGVAAVGLALLAPYLPASELRLYLMLAGALALWLLAIHTVRRPLPKELLVGPFFAASAFIPSATEQRIVLGAVLFAALCSLNCIYIHVWEHANPRHHQRLMAATLALILIASTATTLRPINACIALAATLLLVVHCARCRFARTTLRALADLALLTPLVVAFWPK